MNTAGQDAELREQLKLHIRLEGIFMPEARRQRDKFYHNPLAPDGVAQSAKFVHYTTAEAALSIIQSKRIWMRNVLCMTDYREVQHGFEILQRYFSAEVKASAFKSALDACVPGAAEQALELFNQWLNDIRLQTYITSISEHDQKEGTHGRLSMWRAFGSGGGSRVALVLNIPWFTGAARALSVDFSPVSYLSEKEIHRQLDGVIVEISRQTDFLCSIERQMVVDSVFAMLQAGVTCAKHEGFREEREWRAVYAPNRNASGLMKSVTKVVSGVPQLIYELPLDASEAPQLAGLEFSRIFDRLIIGPTQFGWPTLLAFKEALEKAGVPPEALDERIVVSGIPIRS